MNTPDPADTLSGALALAPETLTDAQWLDALHDDGEAPPTAELVLVPGYTQTGWERQMVTWLRLAEDIENHFWANLDKPDDLLIYEALQMLGFPRAAAAHMSPYGPGVPTAGDEGTLYAQMLKPAPKAKAAPRRRRPARKTTPSGK